MLKKASTLIVLFLMIALAFNPLLGSADTNTSHTFYVDDDNIQGPWDGTQDYPFLFIQNGINAAEPGDTVFVYEGFYNEHVSIDKPLTLQGESMEDTIIDGTGLGILCTIRETNNVVVSGFTFQNGEPDVEALYIIHSTPVVIEQNRFIDNEGLSIFLGGSNNVIQENEIINNNQGANTVWVVSSGNTLMNNTIENNKGCGISILAGNNIITGNIIKDNGAYGVILADYISVKNTVISENLIQGNNVGIKVPYLTAYNAITNNTIRGNTKSGIIFDSVRSTISYNTIENNSIGLLQRFDSNFNNISHNTFSSNGVGIQNLDTVSNSYTENNFIKNTVHASFFSFIPLHRYSNEELVFNTWDHNYWDNWKIGLPKPIFGLYCVVMPFCLFDKNPADEPFGLEA